MYLNFILLFIYLKYLKIINAECVLKVSFYNKIQHTAKTNRQTMQPIPIPIPIHSRKKSTYVYSDFILFDFDYCRSPIIHFSQHYLTLTVFQLITLTLLDSNLISLPQRKIAPHNAPVLPA